MKRKLGCALLTAALMANSMNIYAADQSFALGDANADGSLTAADSAVVLQKVLNNAFEMPVETLVEDWLAVVDVNSSSDVTSADSAIILQKVLNGSYKMPAEGGSEEPSVETTEPVTYTSDIVLADNDIKVNGLSESNGGVVIDNSANTVTITNGGSYTVTGTLTNGQIIVDADSDTELNLNGVDITNNSGPAIYGLNGDIDISAKKGTTNTLSDGTPTVFETETAEDGTVTTTDEPDACIFTHDGLKLKGTGKLIVNGNYKNGISGKDEVKIQKIDLTVNAVNNALKGKDYVTVSSGTLDLTARTGDGIRCTTTSITETETGNVTIEDGTVTINSADNGIFTKGGNVVINGGTINITDIPSGTADTETYNYDGIHAKAGAVTISGGSVTVKSYCDGIQAAGLITISDPAVIDVTTTGVITTSASGSFGGWSNNQTADISAKGIKSDTDMVVDGGTITVNSTDDSLHTNGTITLNAAKITVSSGDDGVHADTVLTINDGCDLTVSKSYEGVEGESIYFNGGKIIIYADDDSINAAGGNDGSSQGGFNTNADGYIEINGGYIYCQNTRDGDGIDSNGKIVMNNGVLLVNGPTSNGNGAIDFGDKSTDGFAFNGGSLFAVGSSGMAETPTANISTANTVAYGTSGGSMGGGRGGSMGGTTTASIPAGTLVTLADSSGNVIAAFKTANAYSSVVVSSSDIKTGSAYTLYTGGTYSGTLDENGYGTGGTISGGTSLGSATVTSTVTKIG